MALDERYMISGPLNQYFVDKNTGLPLASGTITFYRDDSRAVLKDVYQLSGTPGNYSYVALPNPITLSAVGTVQNGAGDNEVIYYYPYIEDADGNLVIDLYYIECRSSGGVLQWTREAWPNLLTGSDPTADPFPVQNQIANPQFTRVLCNQGRADSYAATGTLTAYDVAPNWSLELQGSGNVVIQQVPVLGSSGIETRPPYVLDVTVPNTVTTCLLRQRLYVNTGLWTSTATTDVFLAGTLLGKGISGNVGVSMYFRESSGVNASTPVRILSGLFGTGGFTLVKGGTEDPIPSSTNSQSGTNAYVDIYLEFSPSTQVQISSVQVVPVLDANAADIAQYDEQSANREQALMGDYYIPRLEAKPVPSLLVGWEFPLNPAQFGESGTMAAAAATDYIWDQTIAAGNLGTETYSRNSVTGGLQVVTPAANNAFYIMQYIDGKTAKSIIGNRMSVNVNCFRTTTGNDVAVRVSLWRAASTGTFPTLPTSIVQVSSAGLVTATAAGSAAGWTIIPRSGMDTATKPAINTVDLASANTGVYDAANNFTFTGWELTNTAQIANTDKLAIVVSFSYSSANTIVINNISLDFGDIPSIPGLMTQDQVLQQARYYYETSYAQGTTVPTATYVGQRIANLFNSSPTGLTSNMLPRSFQLNYVEKRTTPTLTFYSPEGTTADRALAFENVNGTTAGAAQKTTITMSTQYGQIGASPRGVSMYAKTPTSTITGPWGSATPDEVLLSYHFVADARLGKV